MDEGNDIESTILNRKIARKHTGDAASKGNQVAGMLAEIENAASPYYLGEDSNSDDSDLDVFP